MHAALCFNLIRYDTLSSSKAEALLHSYAPAVITALIVPATTATLVVLSTQCMWHIRMRMAHEPCLPLPVDGPGLCSVFGIRLEACINHTSLATLI
jgi:hypothetical protein